MIFLYDKNEENYKMLKEFFAIYMKYSVQKMVCVIMTFLIMSVSISK